MRKRDPLELDPNLVLPWWGSIGLIDSESVGERLDEVAFVTFERGPPAKIDFALLGGRYLLGGFELGLSRFGIHDVGPVHHRRGDSPRPEVETAAVGEGPLPNAEEPIMWGLVPNPVNEGHVRHDSLTPAD